MNWQIFPGEWYLDAGVLLLALGLDFVLREPPEAFHPVVWMGRVISWSERIFPRESKVAALVTGMLTVLLVPALFGGITWLVALGLRELGAVFYLLGGALLLNTTFAVKGLGEAATITQRTLETGELEKARHSLRNLVSRDTQTLTEPQVAAAAIESVAENTTDSYIAPWLAFALLGLPGAFAYRALNTLDSMIGYHGKYEYSGKASARLDDFFNLVPARLSAFLLLAAGMLTGCCNGGIHTDSPDRYGGRLSPQRGWRIMWREHGLTESPNAGWTFSAMSGLLGVALEKRGHYRIGNDFQLPGPADIGYSVRLAYMVAALGTLVTIGALILRGLLAG